MFSLFDIERRMIPEYFAGRELRAMLDKNPQLFWESLFSMIQLSRGICACGRPGTIRRIAGLRELMISACEPCRSFWVLVPGIDVPYDFQDKYPEERLSAIEGWRCVRPRNVFIACWTAALLNEPEEEEWLQGLLTNAVDCPFQRQKLIDAILEKENHGR